MSRFASHGLKTESGSALNGSLAWHHNHRQNNRYGHRPYKPGLAQVGARPPQSQIISSGMPALDDLLPDGGWRSGAMTEIMSDINDDSALNLVLPALATVSQEKKWLCWLGPPRFLDKFKLANAGIDISRVLLVYPRASANGLWLVEQVLRAGTCSAVLTWMTGGDAGYADNDGFDRLRRLQLAAEAGGSMGFVFRDPCYANQASSVTTRLLLKKQQQKIQLEVLKSPNTKFADPQVLKFSANRLSRQSHCNRNICKQNYRTQDQKQSSQSFGDQNPMLKNQQLSLY